LQPANLLVGEMEGSYKKVSSHNYSQHRTGNKQ
jgi:hypothetical protein